MTNYIPSKMSAQQNIIMTKCQHGQMSRWWNVNTQNVLVTKYQHDRMLERENINGNNK